MEKLLTVAQLQERLQVDRMTIYRMLKDGRLKGVKVGGQWRFRDGDVARLLESSLTSASGTAISEPSLPLPCLQAMQQLFSEAAGVAAVVVDLEGQPLTEFSNGCSFCSLILASEIGRQRCLRSWAALADGVDSAPRLQRCHAGLLYARATIHVEGRPLAAVLAGQALGSDQQERKQDGRWLAEVAEACGVPLARLQEAYPSIHRLDESQQAKMLHLLKILGLAACRIGTERQRLVAKLDRIAQITLER